MKFNIHTRTPTHTHMCMNGMLRLKALQIASCANEIYVNYYGPPNWAWAWHKCRLKEEILRVGWIGFGGNSNVCICCAVCCPQREDALKLMLMLRLRER